MSFKPDYGLRLKEEGISEDVDLDFYDFHLYSLTLLGNDQFSTMVEIPVDDELHALSLDFTISQLNEILSKATLPLANYLRKELARDSVTLRTIDFEGEVIFGVRARLGELQVVQNERFVPLVAREIMG